LALGSDIGQVSFWDTAQGTLLPSFAGSVAEQEDMILLVFNISFPPPPFTAHAKTIRAIAFSADSSLLITGSDDRRINIFDVRTSPQQGSLASEDMAKKGSLIVGN
jgi:WD40 repeat protein